MELQILSETEIEIYSMPDKRVKQRVVTYLAEGLAPRTVWIPADQLPDAVYQAKNPGKTIPADIITQGDVVRRKLIEADIARIGKAPQARKI